MIGHASNASGIDSYRYYIYSFHMPLFFIISGMAFYFQLSKRDWTFPAMLKNKAKTLLWPYLTLNLIAIPIWLLNYRVLSYRDESIPTLFLAILYSRQSVFSSATNATWFILTLFLALMALFIIIKWAANNEQVIALCGVLAGVLGYVSAFHKPGVDLPWHIDTVPMAMMLLVMGYVFIQYAGEIQRYFSKWYVKVPWILVLLGGGFCCARYNVKISMASNTYGSLILFLGAVVCFSMVCVLISMMLPPLRIFKFIGRNTIIFLALHAPCFRFMAVYSEATKHFKQDHPIILGTAVFILMIGVAFVIEKWLPFLIGRPYGKFKKEKKPAN